MPTICRLSPPSILVQSLVGVEKRVVNRRQVECCSVADTCSKKETDNVFKAHTEIALSRAQSSGLVHQLQIGIRASCSRNFRQWCTPRVDDAVPRASRHPRASSYPSTRCTLIVADNGSSVKSGMRSLLLTGNECHGPGVAQLGTLISMSAMDAQIGENIVNGNQAGAHNEAPGRRWRWCLWQQTSRW